MPTPTTCARPSSTCSGSTRASTACRPTTPAPALPRPPCSPAPGLQRRRRATSAPARRLGSASPFADPTASDAGAHQGGEPSRSGPRADGGGQPGNGRGEGPGRAPQSASWSDAPPPPDTAPSWASPLELAKAAVAVETETEAAAPERVVDDTAISDDDESIDDLTDVGVPVVERILGGTVIAEDSR